MAAYHHAAIKEEDRLCFTCPLKECREDSIACPRSRAIRKLHRENKHGKSNTQSCREERGVYRPGWQKPQPLAENRFSVSP